MRKRKERVEKWREEQRKKAMENIGELKKEIEEMKQGKKWSLEDDDDDEDDPAEAEKEGNEMEGEELDPLDAYMEEVKEEVKKFNMRSVKGGGGNEKVGNFSYFSSKDLCGITLIHCCIDLLLTCVTL